jgi:hypothetical protein
VERKPIRSGRAWDTGWGRLGLQIAQIVGWAGCRLGGVGGLKVALERQTSVGSALARPGEEARHP